MTINKSRIFNEWTFKDTLNPTLLAMVSEELATNNEVERKILDVGCSTGVLGKKLCSRFKVKMYGIEVFPEAARAARKYYDNVYEIDLEKIACGETQFTDITKETFDYIVFGDILEHLSYPEEVLRATCEALNPDAKIFVSIPNVAFLPLRLRLLFGDFCNSSGGCSLA